MEERPKIKGQLELEAEQFHLKNPHIYKLVCRFAKEAIDAGQTKYSVPAIWEVIRWEIKVKNKDLDFKMPNNHRAYYARWWLNKHPDYPRFFRLATLRSVNHPFVDRFGRDIDDEDEGES